MTALRTLLRYLAAPVFLAMAGLTWALNSKSAAMGDMPGMAMPHHGATVLGMHLSAGVVDAAGSWWLMYLLMAVFAVGPWLEFGKK